MQRPDVRVDSPLMRCRLLNLSVSGLAVETDVGMRLGVPYPFRLRHAEQTVSLEAEVRWCRFVGTERGEATDQRPVYRAGAAFVDWQSLGLVEPEDKLELEIESAVDNWIEANRSLEAGPRLQRKVIHHAPRRDRR